MRRSLFVVALAIGLLALLAAPTLASAKTIYVSPNGTNDTAHIRAAFAAAGPGGTVQLRAGHFTINDILVAGFTGAFRGAGKSRTVIDCPDGGVSVESGFDFPYLICFRGGAITVSDMSFDITSPAPAAPWSIPDTAHQDATNVATILYFKGQTSATSDRVGFAGYSNDATGYAGYNVDQSVVVEDTAACAMSGCTCTTADGLWAWSCSDAKATVGGPCQGNVFDTPGFGCAFIDFNASQVTVSGNRFVTGESDEVSAFGGTQGIWVYQDPGTAHSHYVITGNTMRTVTAEAIGLADGDGTGARAIDATVTGNRLDLGTADNPAFAGVGEGYTQNIKCLGNVLSGYATTGFAVGGDPLDDSFFPVSGWQIIGNDCRRLTADVADVWLSDGTTHCLVVGGPPPTTVFDQGTANILVNVTQVPDQAAPLLAGSSTQAPTPSAPSAPVKPLMKVRPY